MTTNIKTIYQNLSSLVGIPEILHFGNFSFNVHFTLDRRYFFTHLVHCEVFLVVATTSEQTCTNLRESQFINKIESNTRRISANEIAP